MDEKEMRVKRSLEKAIPNTTICNLQHVSIDYVEEIAKKYNIVNDKRRTFWAMSGGRK